MKTIEIIRIENTETHTLGVMTLDGVYIGMTIERPWKNNQRSVSCIPAGEYGGVVHNSQKFGKCLWIHDVPERSEILVHLGNYVEDSTGCVLLGTAAGYSHDNRRMVTNSKVAMSDLLKRIGSETDVKFKIRRADNA